MLPTVQTKLAHFTIAHELCALLEGFLRNGSFDYRFTGPQTVKHLVESLGIPHTEIGSILVDNKPSSQDHIVMDREAVLVLSVGTQQDDPCQISSEPRFILDGHLGRLAAYLRMLGLDCLYQNDYTDRQLVEISTGQSRILLTRDRRLLMHKIIQDGCLLRSLDPEEQFLEVIHRYNLIRWVRPFRRCLICNHELTQVEKRAILDRLKPLTRKYFDDFRICPGCQRIYWKGSHNERMLRLIDRVISPGNHLTHEDIK